MRLGRNIALMGVPRAGTTLACNLLDGAADTVALFEPIQIHALALEPAQAVNQIEIFFNEARTELSTVGTCITHQTDGEIPDNPFSATTNAMGVREHLSTRGKVQVNKALQSDFTLVVKHNAAFTALLPVLACTFEVYAIVRNPLAVLQSWQSVDLPVSQGWLPAGTRYCAHLSRVLESEPNVLERQLHILDWFFSNFFRHVPRQHVLRYEDVIATGGLLLRQRLGCAVHGRELRNRNANPVYRASSLDALKCALLAKDGAWKYWYGEADIATAHMGVL